MRRGHHSVGGWRGENQRHFRPRGCGPPNFRPSRPFSLLDTPRFPPPGPRQFRGPRPYSAHAGRTDNVQHSDHHDRNIYRVNNVSRSHDRFHRDRQMPPFNHQRHNDNEYGEGNFYNKVNQNRVNKMSEVDHRRQQPPWAGPPSFDNSRQYYDEHRSPHKASKHFNLGDEMPDYSGHRPPASDHYTTTSGPNNNNSQYTHSVDDTVDIIRKRLLNRDKQPNLDMTSPPDHQTNTEDELRMTKENCQEVPQEQPVKRRIQRQKQNIKKNCDKMKNKIVHQLFKMDKGKIHKLMDNPSSSSKFEYAISSLITEGQNSLNKHLRSVAEKSLTSSSTDFMQDDSNTIYEDTFMKQMQGILDPQDTILLEDIKPLVMAELSRVLQLDEYQLEAIQDHTIQDQGMQDFENIIQNQDIQEYENRIYCQDMPDYNNSIQNQSMDEQSYGMGDSGTLPKDEPEYPYYDESNNPEEYTQDLYADQNQSTTPSYNNMEVVSGDIDNRQFSYEQQTFEVKPLFERRPSSRTHKRERSLERQFRNSQEQSRNSMENTFPYGQENSDNSRDRAQCIPLFDPNVEQLSDNDDDPFAELDKQYHVPVDHTFIGNEYASRPSSPQPLTNNQEKSPPPNKPLDVPQESVNASVIKKEIDTQLQDIAKSPVKLYNYNDKLKDSEPKMRIDFEVKKSPEQLIEKENLSTSFTNAELPHAHVPSDQGRKKEIKEEADKVNDSANKKIVLQSNSRKRSTDQKPSHRKEKRKRSSQSESQEVAKSILNMFYVKNMYEEAANTQKVGKQSDATDKAYSDKYVKRKEPHKKPKEKDSDVSKTSGTKKRNNSSSNSNLNLKDNVNNDTNKADSKVKLKPIDMFVEQAKKSTHQPHRNTAAVPQANAIPSDDSNPKAVIPMATSFARKLSRRHIGTQAVFKSSSKACQTNKVNKLCVRHTQTDPVSISISKKEASNPLERMKEIDMEIQLLLQEKFKLYNSLETKSTAVPIDSIPSLSMRVFNVNTEEAEDKSNDSADAIVDDFTSIPTDELEQIALESLSEDKDPPKSSKKKRKVLELERKSSESPSRKQCKKTKTPNFSLIEQIIIDDRPLEDIISLDDLETVPQAKKKSKPLPKKKNSRKSKISKNDNQLTYDIKDCSVVLERIDLSKYLLRIKSDGLSKTASKVYVIKSEQVTNNTISFEVPIVDLVGPDDTVQVKSEEPQIDVGNEREDGQEPVPNPQNVIEVVEEVNDLQFDMLDVSEDIVIEDNSERNDERPNEREVVNEEVIMDNSQSSAEEGTAETAETEEECRMYDYSTNEILKRDAIEVSGNADAVLAIECVDNDFIAACLDGNVYHFSGDGQLLNTLRGTNQAVTCLTIVKEKYGTTVYTGSLDSRIRYYDLETGLEKGPECNVLSPIQTMDRAWDTVFVGTRTGFVLQFECKNNMLIPVSTIKFSEQSILALRAMKEGPRKVLLVAARSENMVAVKDAQSGLLLRTLEGPKMSVYTLLFEEGKVYCGTSSHSIHVFDYTSGNHVGTHEGGKGAVCLRASGGLLFAGCYDGCVYVYREGAPRPIAQLRGPSLMLLSLAIHGTKIIVGYKDTGLYIWKMPLAIVQEMIL